MSFFFRCFRLSADPHPKEVVEGAPRGVQSVFSTQCVYPGMGVSLPRFGVGVGRPVDALVAGCRRRVAAAAGGIARSYGLVAADHVWLYDVMPNCIHQRHRGRRVATATLRGSSVLRAGRRQAVKSR